MMFVLVDWKVSLPNGGLISEKKCSVLSMASIVSPRKEFPDYFVSELIQARWGRALYHAEILAIHGKCPKETSNLLCYGHLPYDF